VQDGAIARVVKRSSASLEPLSGIKRKRTFRSCVACRDSKVKCSGERPTCTRCDQRLTACVYDAEANEPAWVQSVAVSALSGQSPTTSGHPAQIPRNAFGSTSTDISTANCPPSLTWYVLRPRSLPLSANVPGSLRCFTQVVRTRATAQRQAAHST
jgi:hypothetical protein